MTAPLIFGVEVWIAVFAAMFVPLHDLRAGMPAAVEYLLVLFLPQVVSSIAGAFAFVAAQRRPRRDASRGAAFAAVTCLITVLGTTLLQFLTGVDQWTGRTGAGWIIGLAIALVAVDVLVAAIGGYLIGLAVARLGRRRGTI